MLVRVVGKNFVCGVVLDGDRIVRCAPYLSACMRRAGKHGRTGLREIVRRNGWRAEIVDESCAAAPIR